MAGFEYTKYIADNLCNDGIPLFKGKNVQDGKIIYEFESYIPLDISNELSRSQITRKCLLTPYVGTIGNIGIHSKEGIFHLGSNVGKIELYNQSEVLLEEYVVAYMKSTYGYKELTKHINKAFLFLSKNKKIRTNLNQPLNGNLLRADCLRLLNCMLRLKKLYNNKTHTPNRFFTVEMPVAVIAHFQMQPYGKRQ